MSARPFHRSQADMLPQSPAPAATVGAVGWLRANLFSDWLSTVLTFLSAALLWAVVPPFLDWALFEADFTGATGNECTAAGACWAWLDQRISQFLYGFYPPGSYWRVDLALALLVPALAYVLFENLPWARYGRWFSVAYPVIAAVLLVGGFGLEGVSTDKFGGFMLNVVAGLAGIVLSLPIGIVLALGRRSRLPIVRILSVVFIEAIRGVPLITLLFVAIVILQLFLPPNVSLDQLVRVMIMVTLFASAYMAEVIRGRTPGDPRGAVRGGARDGARLLADDAPHRAAAGAQDLDPRQSSTRSSACSRTRRSSSSSGCSTSSARRSCCRPTRSGSARSITRRT